jgi:hypothetical protein
MDVVPAIANTVTMQSAKARLRNKVVVLFFLILCPIREEMERVWPNIDRTTRPWGEKQMNHAQANYIKKCNLTYLQEDLFWYESDNHRQDLSHLIKTDIRWRHSGFDKLPLTFL